MISRGTVELKVAENVKVATYLAWGSTLWSSRHPALSLLPAPINCLPRHYQVLA